MKERIKYLEYKLNKINHYIKTILASSELVKKTKDRDDILDELLFYKTLQGLSGEPSDKQKEILHYINI